MTGAELKEWRTRHKLSQQEMGNLLHVSYAAVQSWEVGRRPIHPLMAEGIRAIMGRHARGKAAAAAK